MFLIVFQVNMNRGRRWTTKVCRKLDNYIRHALIFPESPRSTRPEDVNVANKRWSNFRWRILSYFVLWMDVHFCIWQWLVWLIESSSILLPSRELSVRWKFLLRHVLNHSRRPNGSNSERWRCKDSTNVDVRHEICVCYCFRFDENWFVKQILKMQMEWVEFLSKTSWLSYSWLVVKIENGIHVSCRCEMRQTSYLLRISMWTSDRERFCSDRNGWPIFC